MSDDEKTCEHLFVADGVRFRHADTKRPGSGSRDRHYFRGYVCQRCLVGEYVPLTVEGTSYDDVKYGAIPMPRSHQ